MHNTVVAVTAVTTISVTAFLNLVILECSPGDRSRSVLFRTASLSFQNSTSRKSKFFFFNVREVNEVIAGLTSFAYVL
jgi:hypothetical protein